MVHIIFNPFVRTPHSVSPKLHNRFVTFTYDFSLPRYL